MTAGISLSADFLSNGGEMAKLIRAFDWQATSLGPIAAWPQNLKTAVNIALQSPVPIVMLWGKDGVMIYNDAYSVFAGRRHPFLLGSKVVEGWPEVADYNRNVLRHVLKGEQLSYKDQQLTLYRNNVAEEVWMDLNYSPIMDDHGKPAAVWAIVVETTKRIRAEQKQRRAEDALQAEKKRLHSLFMHAPAAIAVMSGPDLVFELANGPYRKMVGEDRELIGRPLMEVLPDLEPHLLDIIRRVAFEGKRFVADESPVLLDWDSNGKPYAKYLNFVYEPVFDEQKKPDGFIAFAYDVSEQIAVRRKVEESRKRYRSLLQTIDQGFAIVEVLLNKAGKPVDYRFIETNAMFEAHTGMKDVAGKTVKELLPDLEPQWVDMYGKVALTRKAKRFIDHAEPLGKWFDVYASPVGAPSEHKVALLFTDITERRRGEDALRESEGRLRFMAETMPQKVFTALPDGTIDYFNPEWVEFTGMSYEQIQEVGWPNLIHPDDVEGNLKAWRHAVATGEPLQVEHRFRRHDGAYHWHLTRARAMRDSRGRIVRWFGSSTDIQEIRTATARKDELETVAASLRQQQEELVALNEAKDEFISVASHQLRTPATAVKQYLGMVLEGYAGESPEPQRSLLDRAWESNERQISIINDLLKVAQVDAGKVQLQRQKTDMVALTAHVLEEQAGKFTERKQTVSFTHTAKEIVAIIDPQRIHMVLENIIDNASKYTPHGKAVNVHISKDHNKVVVAVHDEGVGIDPADIEKLFRKFTRLDNPLSVIVGGNGLGLYWAKKIIDLHDGSITVVSEPDKGSTFAVSLPV